MTEAAIKRLLRAHIWAWAFAAVFIVVGQALHLQKNRDVNLSYRIAVEGAVNRINQAQAALLYSERLITMAVLQRRALLGKVVRLTAVNRVLIRAQGTSPAMAQRIARTVIKAGNRYDIDPYLLLAKLEVESNYNPRAVSRTGARGLAQIVRGTARDLSLPWDKAFDVERNIMAGARYLRELLDKTSGDLYRALGRYNGWDDPQYHEKIFRVYKVLAVATYETP